MATLPHVTSGLGLRKFQADGFLLTRVYINVFFAQRDSAFSFFPSVRPHVLSLILLWRPKGEHDKSRGSWRQIFSLCLHLASIVSKTLFIIPTDAHYYKNHRMIKQFKIITLVPACFVSHRNHHQGAILCLAKTTEYDFSVVIGIDAVNVMATYQFLSSLWTARLHNRLICRHNIDYVSTDEHR